MASCKTSQWTTYAPYVKLTVTESSSTSSTATLTWKLYYISEYAAETSSDKSYTVKLDGSTVKTGTFDIDGKTGTILIASGTKNITRTTSTKTVAFSVSFDFKLTWSGVYAGTLSASSSIAVTAAIPTYSACGAPTSLSITDNGDNTIKLSCKVGSNGSLNVAEAMEVFVTYDGSTPSASNYSYTYTFDGAANAVSTKKVSFEKLTESTMSSLLGADCVGPIKFTARTLGEAGSTYYSALATAVSSNFTWHGKAKPPKINTPAATGETTGLLASYKVSWSAGAGGSSP